MKKVRNELAIDIDYHLKAVKTYKMCCKVFTVKWHPKQWGAEFVLPWKRGMNFKHHRSLLPSVQRQWHCVKIWERKSFLLLLVLEVWWNHYLVCSGCQVTNSQVDWSISVLYVGRMLTADCILQSQSFSRGSVRVAHTSLSHRLLTLEIADILNTDWHLLFSGHLMVKIDEKLFWGDQTYFLRFEVEQLHQTAITE